MENAPTYRVIREEEGGQPIYGVEAPGVGTVHRLSTDRAELEALVERFNAGVLSPLHFHEAIEDFRRA